MIKSKQFVKGASASACPEYYKAAQTFYGCYADCKFEPPNMVFWGASCSGFWVSRKDKYLICVISVFGTRVEFHGCYEVSILK